MKHRIYTILQYLDSNVSLSIDFFTTDLKVHNMQTKLFLWMVSIGNLKKLNIYHRVVDHASL